MKSQSLRLLMWLGLILCWASTARAVPLAFEDQNGNRPDNTPVYLNSLCNPSATWLFNLDTDALEVGDIDAADNLLTAALSIDVRDDCFDPILIEIGALSLDQQLVWLGEVNSGTSTLNVLSWVSDHVLNVQICAVLGDFNIDSIVLHGTYEDGSIAPPDEPVVPEPATLALVGLGLSCAGLFRRLRRA